MNRALFGTCYKQQGAQTPPAHNFGIINWTTGEVVAAQQFEWAAYYRPPEQISLLLAVQLSTPLPKLLHGR